MVNMIKGLVLPKNTVYPSDLDLATKDATRDPPPGFIYADHGLSQIFIHFIGDEPTSQISRPAGGEWAEGRRILNPLRREAATTRPIVPAPNPA